MTTVKKNAVGQYIFNAPSDVAVESDAICGRGLAYYLRAAADYLKVRLTDQGDFDVPSDTVANGWGHNHGYGDPWRGLSFDPSLRQLNERPNSKPIFRNMDHAVWARGLTLNARPVGTSQLADNRCIIAGGPAINGILPGPGTTGLKIYCLCKTSVEMTVQMIARNRTIGQVKGINWQSLGPETVFLSGEYTWAECFTTEGGPLRVIPGIPQDVQIFAGELSGTSKIGVYEIAVVESEIV